MLDAYEQLEIRKQAIHGLLANLLNLKQKNDGVTSEMRRAMTEVSVLLVELRLLNRSILCNEEYVKNQTEAAKGPVDSITLRLHNYLYEKNHYRKAIEANEDYRSKFPDPELVSEEDFFRNAPESFREDPELRSNPRKLYLKRLEYELYQRAELAKRKDELEAKKQILDKELAGRRKFLDTLPDQLKILKKAAQPLQQQLGLSLTKKNRHPGGLPSPLFNIFSNLSAQRDSPDAAIDVEVLGKVFESEAMPRSGTSGQTGSRPPSLEGPIDMEVTLPNNGNEEDDENQRRHKRAKPVDKAGEASPIYPLAVALTLYDPLQPAPVHVSLGGPGGVRPALMILKFEFQLQQQKVVVSVIGGTIAPKLPNSAPAESSPTSAQLGSASLESSDRLITGVSARPYKWAQEMAGLGEGSEQGKAMDQTVPLGSAKSPVLPNVQKVLQLLLKQAKAPGKAESSGLLKAA